MSGGTSGPKNLPLQSDRSFWTWTDPSFTTCRAILPPGPPPSPRFFVPSAAPFRGPDAAFGMRRMRTAETGRGVKGWRREWMHHGIHGTQDHVTPCVVRGNTCDLSVCFLVFLCDCNSLRWAKGYFYTFVVVPAAIFWNPDKRFDDTPYPII